MEPSKKRRYATAKAVLSKGPPESTLDCAWMRERAWPFALQKAPISRSSPISKSMPCWRAWNERSRTVRTENCRIGVQLVYLSRRRFGRHNRLEYPANVRVIRLPCTGRIDFNLIIKSFESGADAVLISGCHPGSCHYTSGNYHARRRWILFRELLDTLG